MNRTVILAAGDFPAKGGEPRRILLSASRVVACDSAADAFRREFGELLKKLTRAGKTVVTVSHDV